MRKGLGHENVVLESGHKGAVRDYNCKEAHQSAFKAWKVGALGVGKLEVEARW